MLQHKLSRINISVPGRGVVLKKEVGGRLKQDLDNDLSLTYNINSFVLKVSYTAFQ